MCTYTVDIYGFYTNKVIIANAEQKAISLKITCFLFGEILPNYSEIRLPQFVSNAYTMACVYKHFCRYYENCLFNFASSLNNNHYSYSLLKENCFASSYILVLRNNCLVSKLVYTKKN